MKYSYVCSADNYNMVVDAKDDKEALQKLKELGKKHVVSAHPTAKPMTDAEMDKMFQSGWKKG